MSIQDNLNKFEKANNVYKTPDDRIRHLHYFVLRSIEFLDDIMVETAIHLADFSMKKFDEDEELRNAKKGSK